MATAPWPSAGNDGVGDGGTGIDLGTVTESRPGQIGPIKLDAKHTGKRSVGNPHAAFDVAGAGNGVTVDPIRARREKSRTLTREDLRTTAPVLDPTLPGFACNPLRGF